MHFNVTWTQPQEHFSILISLTHKLKFIFCYLNGNFEDRTLPVIWTKHPFDRNMHRTIAEEATNPQTPLSFYCSSYMNEASFWRQYA